MKATILLTISLLVLYAFSGEVMAVFDPLYESNIQISNISPSNGSTITSNTSISFDMTSDSGIDIRRVFVNVYCEEEIYIAIKSGRIQYPFDGAESYITPIDNGFSINLVSVIEFEPGMAISFDCICGTPRKLISYIDTEILERTNLSHVSGYEILNEDAYSIGYVITDIFSESMTVVRDYIEYSIAPPSIEGEDYLYIRTMRVTDRAIYCVFSNGGGPLKYYMCRADNSSFDSYIELPFVGAASIGLSIDEKYVYLCYTPAYTPEELSYLLVYDLSMTLVNTYTLSREMLHDNHLFAYKLNDETILHYNIAGGNRETAIIRFSDDSILEYVYSIDLPSDTTNVEAYILSEDTAAGVAFFNGAGYPLSLYGYDVVMEEHTFTLSEEYQSGDEGEDPESYDIARAEIFPFYADADYSGLRTFFCRYDSGEPPFTMYHMIWRDYQIAREEILYTIGSISHYKSLPGYVTISPVTSHYESLLGSVTIAGLDSTTNYKSLLGYVTIAPDGTDKFALSEVITTTSNPMEWNDIRNYYSSINDLAVDMDRTYDSVVYIPGNSMVIYYDENEVSKETIEKAAQELFIGIDYIIEEPQ